MIDDARSLFRLFEENKIEKLKVIRFYTLITFKTTDIADKVFSNNTWPSDWLSVCKLFMYSIRNLWD